PAPVLRRHPGASGVPFPPDPAAPPVQGADRGRARVRGAAGGGGHRGQDRHHVMAEHMDEVEQVADAAESWEVVATKEWFSGRVISLRTDTVVMPGGVTADRDYVVHPGSVGVVALDDRNR